MLRLLVGGLALVLTLDIGSALAHGSRDTISNTAPAAGSHESLEELGRRLATLNVEQQRGDAAARAAAIKALLSAAMAREQKLAELIAEHPGAVLRHALSAKLRAMLPPAVQAHVEEDLTTEGELEVVHEDGLDGSRYHYFVNRPEGRLALHFAAEAPALQTGDRVRVSGMRVRQALALESGTSALTLQAATLPNTFGAQKTAVILVNFQDNPTQTWVTPAQAYASVLAADNPRSVSNFFKESSYGQTWLVGNVYGVYTIPLNSTSGCNYGSIASYAKQAAAAEIGATTLSTYRRLVYAFPRIACGWSGLGTVGGSPSQAWINGTPSSGLVSHEMGHNLGLWHSHALYCPNAQSMCSTGGTAIEYGDRFDAMGDGIQPMHFNAVQKELLGWLDYLDSPPIKTVQSSGTYAIDPYETPGVNPKALKVGTPSGDWYYVEYRQALGFDAGLVYNTNVTNGLLVHLWTGNQNPDRIYLLNMRPADNDWTHPALELGSSFSYAGITITPSWAEGTAGVTVSIGGGGGTSCVRSAPTVKVTPAKQQGKPGSAVGYTVSVTNNDTGCGTGTFTQQATVPTGWAASFGASSLSIAAGATASTSLQVTSSAAAAAGTYTVSPKASNTAAPTSSGSATATYDVTTGGATGTFSDTFNRPDSSTLGNGWARVSGSLGIQAYRATTPEVKAMHVATQPGVAGSAQTIAASFASGGNNSAPEFGLLTRYKDAGNYYTCYRRTGGTSVVRISKMVGGVETVLGSVGVANPSKGVPFKLSCEAQGTSLTLSLNGTRKLSVSDSTFGTGSVGMSAGYRGAAGGTAASVWVDDFSAIVQ